jgi:NAD(P)H-nitrite reductase large subunit
MLSKRVGKILTDEKNAVRGVVFEDGEEMECSCICFAVSVLHSSIVSITDVFRSASNRETN